ncbi:hypothetical protein SAMN05216420_1223 [Nitrosospira sp. Nl5]|nr:hypothetical protein SAMN05216420_1223 [Nitrosospira sp. Nl5]
MSLSGKADVPYCELHIRLIDLWNLKTAGYCCDAVILRERLLKQTRLGRLPGLKGTVMERSRLRTGTRSRSSRNVTTSGKGISGCQDNFAAVLFFFVENSVSIGSLGKWHTVTDDDIRT